MRLACSVAVVVCLAFGVTAPARAQEGGGARVATVGVGLHGNGLAPTDPAAPAVARGGTFMGTAERFNRYYTDTSWTPARTLYVSPDGSGDGASRETPMTAAAAVAGARPGTVIYFLRGTYDGCFAFSKTNSGSYDEPVVLFGERRPDRSLAVFVNCCSSGRAACFSFEDADYVALNGFDLVGGGYGVRVTGAGAAGGHARGIAVLASRARDQEQDGFASAQADWTVFERNSAHGAKAGDGIRLGGGGDFAVVRYNDAFANAGQGLRIDGDPAATCKAAGIAYDDPRCDGYAGDGETGGSGRGASDYVLVDANYIHHGGLGARFASLRRSVIRNNIFGFAASAPNASFRQDTDNPRLGSSDNAIVHNLFIATGSAGLALANHAARNRVVNNVMLGVQIAERKALADPGALLMAVDETVADTVYRLNLYVGGGRLEGRSPGAQEVVRADFSPRWFARFPTAVNHDPNDFRPRSQVPFVGMGFLSRDAPTDRNGRKRASPVDLGPIERR